MPYRNSGFSLLEVIVAMALLAGTGVALFDWIGRNLADASRLRERQLSAQLSNEALALVQTINPTSHPNGVMTVDGVTMSWQVVANPPARPVQGSTAEAAGTWQIGLYTLRVQARDSNSGAAVQFDVLQVGTKRIAAGDTASLAR